MANIAEKIWAEMDNISSILSELERVKDRHNKELVVLVGIGAFLQNIYTGIENILKQLLIHKGVAIPQSASWHKDLLAVSVKNDLITPDTETKLGKYLVFRHFFTHSYGFLLEESLVQPLVDNISDVCLIFKSEIENYLNLSAEEK